MSALIFLATILVGFLIYSLVKSMRRPKNFPPGPGFLPWLGNTLQFRREARAAGGQHKLFEQWSKRYQSQLLGLKLGQEYVVVALGHELVREVQLQEVFEGRPDNFFLRLRTMGTRKGITCTDGQLWYEHRNFAMKQMRHVGYGRSQMEQQIEHEADELLQQLSATQAAPIEPVNWLAQSVLNVLWCLIAGERIANAEDSTLHRLLELMNRRSRLFDISGGLLAQFPWLRHVAPNRTGYNLIRELNAELHGFFMVTINEHRRRMLECEKRGEQLPESDLIYAYLLEMQQQKQNSNSFNETQLVMTILDFFIAGSQTTSNTINLALMVLAMRPDVQQQLHAEVAANTSETTDAFPHLSRREAFHYMDAFIMEVQRFFHITPITGPRRALWNTKLGQYDIPRNATILISLRSVHLDEAHWKEPHEFRPERFIDGAGKCCKDEYFMPFGLGRRRCLGDALARACIFSFLVRIVQHFRIVLPAGETPSFVLQPGITLTPKPYKVQFVKRE
ncbi:probable cytochrome P450 305a1 [Drosophila sulfurigaster albostrigata]|uniref:probable cytochrome P450 305a1 n=1 Tax=Drosophila sulfurigaster albostrigata TaxID=89887 RepID=UPI002D21B032|nr:probable cytochrome P450 305a1 [Drosophila sulfurigaster albostrigata]